MDRQTPDKQHTGRILTLSVIAMALVMVAIQLVFSQSAAKQQQRLSALQSEIEQRRLLTSQQEDQDQTGTSARLERDSITMNQLFSDLMDWDSDTAYQQTRQKMITKYGIHEDQQLLEEYMPALEEGQTTEDRIQLNMNFSTTKACLTDIHDSDYSYLAQVTYYIKSPSGYKADAQSLFTLTIDGDGNITQISGYDTGLI